MAIDIPEQYQSLKTKLETIVKKIISPKTISENEDLNDYKEVGMYYCPSGSVATTLSNCPVIHSFSLFIEKPSGYVDATKQTISSWDGHNHSTFTRIIQYYEGEFKDSGWQRVQYGNWKWVADYQGDKIHLYTNGTMGLINISGIFTITCSANTDYTLATIGTNYGTWSVVSHPASYGQKDRNQLILIKGNEIVYNSSTARSNASVGIYCTIFYRLVNPVY